MNLYATHSVTWPLGSVGMRCMEAPRSCLQPFEGSVCIIIYMTPLSLIVDSDGELYSNQTRQR